MDELVIMVSYTNYIKHSIFLTVIPIPDKGPAPPTRSSTYMDTSLSASGVSVILGNQDKTAYVYPACVDEQASGLLWP